MEKLGKTFKSVEKDLDQFDDDFEELQQMVSER